METKIQRIDVRARALQAALDLLMCSNLAGNPTLTADARAAAGTRCGCCIVIRLQ
jgi:hypothetical protein